MTTCELYEKVEKMQQKIIKRLPLLEVKYKIRRLFSNDKKRNK